MKKKFIVMISILILLIGAFVTYIVINNNKALSLSRQVEMINEICPSEVYVYGGDLNSSGINKSDNRKLNFITIDNLDDDTLDSDKYYRFIVFNQTDFTSSEATICTRLDILANQKYNFIFVKCNGINQLVDNGILSSSLDVTKKHEFVASTNERVRSQFIGPQYEKFDKVEVKREVVYSLYNILHYLSM